MPGVIVELGYGGWEDVPGTFTTQTRELKTAHDVEDFGVTQAGICILAL